VAGDGVNACDLVTLAAAPLLLVAVLAAPQEGLPFKPMILIRRCAVETS
jgi:hypothetical protein